MAYKTEEIKEKRYSKPTINGLTPEGLRSLDKELQGYAVEKDITMPDGKVFHIKYIDDRKWMEDKGALRKGAVYISDFKPAKYSTQGHLIEGCDCDSILYEQLSENLEQWKKWKGRQEYAQKVERTAIDKLAEDMKVQKVAEDFSDYNLPKEW